MLGRLLHELISSDFGYGINSKTVGPGLGWRLYILISSTYEELWRNLKVAHAHWKNWIGT